MIKQQLVARSGEAPVAGGELSGDHTRENFLGATPTLPQREREKKKSTPIEANAIAGSG